MEKIIFILGPTSSGKSAVAVRLAEKIGGEIVSCDSMQVYKDMDVITQAPGDEFLSRVPHHLTRTVPPEEEYSAARFVEEAHRAIDPIISGGRIPVVAGGTGLYVKAFVDGIFSAPPRDEDLRKSLREIAREKGNTHLYRRLEKVDPETAARLHPNDLRRVIRALEVYTLTGKTISEKKPESEGISNNYDCRMFALELSRNILYNRINATVERMFERDLVEEVKRLRKRRLSLTAQKALGIKEIGAYLDGQTSIEAAMEDLKKNTRRYAKRQLTWFRADKRIMWIDADRDVEAIVSDIVGRLGVERS